MSTPPTAPEPSDEVPESAPPDEGRRATAVVLGVLVLGIVGVLAWLVLGGDDEDEVATEDPTTTEAPTTVDTAEPTDPPDTPLPEPIEPGTLGPEELATAIFPYDATARRFDDPLALTLAFATELVGFTDPVLGGFRQGDSRSGEVELRATADAPATAVTTVLVRQLGPDDSWWVIGAVTQDIEVASPATGGTVSSPVEVSGRATGFEGNVVVTVHRDGDTAPIGTGFVTGGALGQLEPFSGEVDFAQPGEQWGALVFSSEDVERGGTWVATVLRVAF